MVIIRLISIDVFTLLKITILEYIYDLIRLKSIATLKNIEV